MTTPAAIRAAQESATEMVWLYLLTIQPYDNGAPAGSPVRIVNNNEPVLANRGGNPVTFEPYPFEVALSSDDGQTLPTVNIDMMHLEGAIANAVRQHNEPPHVTIELVLASTPDQIERRIDHAIVSEVSYDAFAVRAQLVMYDTLHADFPRQNYAPIEFPGLYL